MAAYFSNFPSIQYKTELVNAQAKNILLRGIMRDEAKKITIETLEMRVGDRADYLSHLLYKTSENDYIFYLMNDIVDPYYEWYLTDAQFNEFVNNKYGEEVSNTHHYEKMTTKNSLAAVYLRPDGGGSGFVNGDFIAVGQNGLLNDRGIAVITTSNTGNIVSFSVNRAGKNINDPFKVAIRRGGAPLVNDTASFVPVLDDFAGEEIIINTETYDYLPQSEKIKYEAVSNHEYEQRKNFQNRLLNAVQPNIAAKIQTQLKTLLSGSGRL